MMPFLRGLLVLLHLLAAMIWVGGMGFAYFCLRPAAAEVLDPPRRLPLWVATLDRFLRIVAGAVIVILLSGVALLLDTGLRAAPGGWLLMAGLGTVMALVFSHLASSLFPELRRRCLASDWPGAAAVLDAIRRRVALNLLLALGTILAAVQARY